MTSTGIDLGSRNVKVALLGEDNSLSLHKYDTITFYRERGRKAGGRLTVDFTGLGLAVEPGSLVATGYGRQTVDVAGAKVIPEITAHVAGAVFLTGLTDFTLLDLGGQDSKVAKVARGRLVDFMTNDRCAASTGRYLENMAAVLDISLDELSRHCEDPVDLNSTCAIFGESELIGKIVEGVPVESLAAGVNYTIFKRIRPMLLKLGGDTVVFTGGVAYNKALRTIIERETGVRVVVPEHPDYAGAVGCCAVGRGE
ncbi:MAG: acyl-CoA dehydratase activase [Firmicutes bacterium]|nr:acyl-CoA dehydratase activase [Bacillota bacterium]